MTDEAAELKTDCGEACAALTERQRRVHLLILSGSTIADAYASTAPRGSSPKRESCHAHGSRMVGSGKFQAALAHHRRVEAARYRATRDRSVERLADAAEGANLVRVLGEDGQLDVRALLADRDLGRAVRGIEYDDAGNVKKVLFHSGVQFENALAKLGGWEAPRKVEITGLPAFGELLALAKDPTPTGKAAAKLLAELAETIPRRFRELLEAGDGG